jgi:TetR/AcrR family transcriptional regulator, transcriptional repressor for nem operon
MPRIVNEKEYAGRRNSILDAAQRLVYTTGYEGMSIQDILDDLKISKGAFYHYFDSKQDLLEALIERMMEEAEQAMLPIVQDSSLPALEKLQRFYNTSVRWKTDRKTLILAILRAWYKDDNAIVRQKATASAMSWFSPLFTEIIHQGIQEGVFANPFPEQVGDIALCLLLGLGDSIALLLLPEALAPDVVERLFVIQAAYNDALERVLGAPSGSIHLIEEGVIQEWVVPEAEIS